MEAADENPRLVVTSPLQQILTDGHLFWQPDALAFDVRDFGSFKFFGAF